MKVQYKAAIKEKEFTFKEGDNIKIVVTSFLYATETRPERIYMAQLLETEENGFWAKLSSLIVHPYSFEERLPGVAESIDSDSEEFFCFEEVEDVLPESADYPDRRDPLIRFALDGPN
ncbi:hypothetical protein [Paenibacillus tyrfis]|uniref:hypothetical protein n=1 Tax=Paenibacillus tyrfis TaxID=1501230 RepID=UPI00117FCE0E|nr:hypothetical protein [Paenibacillus tyrfis]